MPVKKDEMDVIIKKSRRKSLTLRVLDAKTLIVLAPYGCPDRYISDFIGKKAGWIDKKRREFEIEEFLLKNLTNFNQIMYFGALLDVISDKKCSKITLAEGVFYVPDADLNALKRKFKQYFIKESQIILEKAVKQHSKAQNLLYNSFKTNVYKAKWGSCNTKKDIALNAALIMLDKSLINYVIAHELCHLKHFNHSKLFWQSVEKIIPDYKKLKTRLKSYNYLLKILA